jgi:hypothetical protein
MCIVTGNAMDLHEVLFFLIQFFWSFDFFSIVFWDWSLLFVLFGLLFITCDGEK